MIATMLIAATAIASTPSLGTATGACRANEPGPAFLVSVDGLKDRIGRLRLELYPDNDADFLADDNLLVAAGKPFARIDVPTPERGDVLLCIRAPRSGRYALSLLHDRDGNRRFAPSSDGIGFSANPELGWSKPKAASVGVAVGDRPIPLTITLNYRRGLSMRPLDRK